MDFKPKGFYVDKDGVMVVTDVELFEMSLVNNPLFNAPPIIIKKDKETNEPVD